MKAAKEGLNAAEAFGIPAVAVFVVDTSEYKGQHQASIKQSIKSGLKERGEKAFDEVRKMADEIGVELETELIGGKPFKEITGLADKEDIIYICTHGWSGFTNLFLGSTTEKVIKNARCTVAVVEGKF